jgi:imidazolonepropionase-like amidohydrolase
LIVEQGLQAKDRMPSYAYDKLVAIADHHNNAISIAHEAGVKIAVGTDIFASGGATGLEWGMNGREFGYLVAAGLSPLEAIEAGTANGPATLGPQAPRSGVLAEGFDADVIALSSNPADNVTVLADPWNVTHVWKAGRLVKSPGRSHSEAFIEV